MRKAQCSQRQLNTTCLGSLYIQDFTGATTLCEMRIVEHTETVLQMQDNWYLVYSPVAFTGYVICMNNSNSEVFIKTGPNHIFVSPSCRMRLKHHVLISDFSLHLDSIIKHYKWGIDEIAFSPEERLVSERWLEILGGRKRRPLYSPLHPPRNRCRATLIHLDLPLLHPGYPRRHRSRRRRSLHPLGLTYYHLQNPHPARPHTHSA